VHNELVSVIANEEISDLRVLCRERNDRLALRVCDVRGAWQHGDELSQQRLAECKFDRSLHASIVSWLACDA
jgi:hypothetical protein